MGQMSSSWMPQRMSRRTLLGGTLAGAAGLTVAGCSGNSSGGSSGQAHVRFATDWTEGARGSTMKAALADFEKANPDIKVKLEPIGGNYFDKLQVQFTGGTVADVILFEGELAAEYIQGGLLADIEPTLKKLNVDESQWHPDVPSVFKDNGKRYAVPFQLTPTVWFYNKTLFEKKGVTPPDPNWTWDDLLQAAMKLTDPPDSYGVTPIDDMFNAWAGLGLANSNTHWVSPDFKKTMFGDPGWAEAITWAIELTTKYKVTPAESDTLALEKSGVTDLFANGKYGMRMANAGSVGTFALDINDRFKWDLMPTPKAPRTGRRGGMWNDQCNVVTSKAKDRGVDEQATKLVLFLAGESVQKRIAKDRGSTPTLKSVQESQTYLAGPPDSMKLIVDELPDEKGPLFFPNFLNWYDAVTKQYGLGIAGNLSPDSTVQSMVTAGDKILAGG